MGKKLKNIRKKTNWEESKNELNRKIDLSCGIEELRRNLGVFEDMEGWKARGK